MPTKSKNYICIECLKKKNSKIFYYSFIMLAIRLIFCYLKFLIKNNYFYYFITKLNIVYLI